MKKIRYILFTGIALSITASSCQKDFLEIVPKGKLIAQTLSDYNKSLTSLDVVNLGTEGQIPMGDEIAAVDPVLSSAALRTQRLFKWEDVIYLAGEDQAEMKVTMQNIYLYNKIINEVMSATTGTEEEKRAIQAKARVGRAWTYFMLINYFGKPYNEASAASDPGFPLITAADVTINSFSRASVKEIYDFIVEDLKTAIPDLPVQLTHRLVPTKSAGEGLLGKVYVFMGKFNEALPYLNDAIAHLANPAIAVGLYNYNVTFGPGGSFLPIGLFGPTYPTTVNNEENILCKQASSSWTFTNNELVIAPAALALYGSTDLRLNWYSVNQYPSGPYPAGLKRRIGPGTAQVGVTVPDLYLLLAEAKARTNDLGGARAEVEAFRKKRISDETDALVPDDIAGDKISLVKFILEERIREFAVIGYRWFDMRRLSIDPDYSNTVGHTHTVYDADGNVSATYTLKPERFQLQFAPKVMELNPGFENNP